MNMNAIDIYFEINYKDTLVDFLLSQGYNDFYFFSCNRYGAGAFLKSTHEQVSARADFGVFKLFLDRENIIALSSSIKQELHGKNIKMYTYGISEL
ncbi:MAG: hypothetical protein B7Y17_01150 [Sulfuricurvum sp. 24-42-5]|nr:MAG: hypothetical protein B7Y17_01150 [Sulfuricurvum sp. 24-42-5]